jgi:hypothetical protein
MQEGAMPLDEVRLIARGFAALQPKVLLSEKNNVPIFDDDTITQSESNPEYQNTKRRALKPHNNPVNMLNLFKSLAKIISYN